MFVDVAFDFSAAKRYNTVVMKNTSPQNCDTAKNARVYLCRVPDNENARYANKIELQDKFAFRLLCFAYKETFGKSSTSQNLRKLPSGKWVCDHGFVSISHSGDFVAVALSENAVGVDLQKCTNVNMSRIASKLFTKDEQAALNSAENFTECFFFTWCKKEALWKSLDVQPPTVSTVDTSKGQFFLQKLQLDGETFYLAVTEPSTVITVSTEIVAENQPN